MENLPAKLADTLEAIAARVRSLTVDRVDRIARIAALALPVAVLGIIALSFLFLTVFEAVAIPLGRFGAYLVFGAVFLIGGLVAWIIRRRDPRPDTEEAL